MQIECRARSLRNSRPARRSFWKEEFGNSSAFRPTIELDEPKPRDARGSNNYGKEARQVYFRRSPSERSCEIERNTSTANTPSIRYAIIQCPCYVTAQHLMCTPDTSRANLRSLAFAVSASRRRLLLRIILECIVCVLPRPAGFSLQLPTLG